MKYLVYNHHNFWQWEPSNSDLAGAEVVFMWADFPFAQHVRTLKGLGKKVVVFEHGFGALYDYELNSREPMADGYLALGQGSFMSLVRKGVPMSKILITGNPIYDDIKKTKHTGNKALFVALHWVKDMSIYNQVLFDQLVKAYPELDWTVKLIDKSGDITTDKGKWFNNVESDTILADIKEKLPSYDMVFTPNPSTFESFARLMGIPVYVVDEHEAFKASGEPNRMPMNNTYLKIGDKLPRQKKIDMDYHIQRPSLDLIDVAIWATQL